MLNPNVEGFKLYLQYARSQSQLENVTSVYNVLHEDTHENPTYFGGVLPGELHDFVFLSFS